MPIQCPSCGKLTSEKNLLCTFCSQPLMPPSKCKSCGREVPANRTHCLFCGLPAPTSAAQAGTPAQPATTAASQTPVAASPATKPLESFKVVSSPKDTEKLPLGTLVTSLGGTAGISIIAAFVAGILPFPLVFAVAGLIILALAAVIYEHLGGAKFIPHIVASVLVGCVIGAGMAIAFTERPRPVATGPNYQTTQESQPKEMTLYVTEVRGCEVYSASGGLRAFDVSYREKCEFCQALGNKRKSAKEIAGVVDASFYSSDALPAFECSQCHQMNNPRIDVNARKGKIQVK